ncbi:RHS repeat-associated core domain-containing protein [Curtobacterium sp. SORGH_AS_0776]|uniref:RHS repeat-associated core domain-containing protein n=1 Tax=Curtobacterium sp. SORGH_AS_0776 TaxID=3041798 RepID=UPI002859E30A|nr:RHS repeat-associated core domain-containing protein [Curtobacterium sp. SORGH_AS_0776]MDR6169783.1 RHS repeat-associated protein [Curtobacterium sp. SORGH_AS_0776]
MGVHVRRGGNRLTAKQTGDATSSQTSTYNVIGQITSTGYAYDGVGNLTAAPGETFTYNDAQQLTTSTKNGVTTRYEYAGADMNKLLSQSTDGGAEYDYTYGSSDQLGVPVVTSRTVAGTGRASVISDPTTGQPMDLQTTDGVTSMWVIDGIGNPAAAIADTGNTAYTVSYDPYGAETVNGGSSAQWQQNPYGFKAGLRSSSTDNGLTKFGYRWQNSVTGGWIQRDTLDAPLSPTNANRYAYAGDDPINSSDPTGRSTFGDALGIASTALAIGGLAATATGVGGRGSGWSHPRRLEFGRECLVNCGERWVGKRGSWGSRPRYGIAGVRYCRKPGCAQRREDSEHRSLRYLRRD